MWQSYGWLIGGRNDNKQNNSKNKTKQTKQQQQQQQNSKKPQQTTTAILLVRENMNSVHAAPPPHCNSVCESERSLLEQLAWGFGVSFHPFPPILTVQMSIPPTPFWPTPYSDLVFRKMKMIAHQRRRRLFASVLFTICILWVNEA